MFKEKDRSTTHSEQGARRGKLFKIDLALDSDLLRLENCCSFGIVARSPAARLACQQTKFSDHKMAVHRQIKIRAMDNRLCFIFGTQHLVLQPLPR